MKKKFLLAFAILAAFVCLFAASVSAEDKIVVHSDNSLSNEVSRLDALENPSCTDTESKIVLTDLNGNYYVFPAYYFVKNQSNYAIDATNLNAAIASYNEANGTSYFTGFDHTGGTGSQRGKCLNMVRLEVPTYVTTVNGMHKFEGCANLVEVIFPYYYSEEEGRNVGYITSNGTGAQNWFSSCSSLVSIKNFGYLPLTTLQNACFAGCSSLVEIELPYKLEKIVGDGFSGCSSLEKVVFPSTLSSVGNKVFKSCAALTILENFENTQLTAITEEMFAYSTSLTTVEFPSTVTAVKKNAFNGCTALASIDLYEGITELGYRAFYNTGLISVTVPASATTLGKDIFRENKKLTSVVYNASTVTDYCFNSCPSLTTVQLNNVTTIGGRGFSQCTNLSSINLDEGLTAINSCAFFNCKALTSVVVPSTVTYMEDKVFESTGITTAVVKATVVGERMFFGAPLATLTLENTVAIGAYAFDSCKFTEVVLPETVTTIEDNAFKSCKSLKSITIPASVTSIASTTFSYSTALEAVNYTGDNAELMSNVAMPNSSAQVVEKNHCEAYYAGAHSAGDKVIVDDSNYFEKIVVTNSCTRCGMSSVVVEEIEPLFIWLGYSYSEYNVAMAQCFKVNESAIEKYKKYAPDFAYGVVAAVNNTDGAIDALNGEKVIAKEMGELKYDYVDVKVTGVKEEHKGTKIVFCLYVVANGNACYLENDATSNAVNGISYSEILKLK